MNATRLRARAGRWRRRCGFDHNDLRREIDRTQWMFGLLLLLVFLATAPPLCTQVGQDVYASGIRTERSEAAGRHRVEATVVKAKAQRKGTHVTVAWIGLDGTRRTGSYTTWRAASVGDQPRVWAGFGGVSDHGLRPHGQTIGNALTVGTATALALGLPLLGAYLLVRYRCDRRRYQRWGAEWAAFDGRRIGP